MASINIVHLIILMHVCTIVIVMSNTLAIPKFSSILVFGDSLVDTGNNNYIQTHSRADHAPYGKDFPGHVPTGRFSNGKLFTDFLASQLNLKDIVPPYLDPNLSPEELLTGVSFASGGSGIDELTSTISLSIPLSKQVENFKAYVLKLNQIVGENQTQQILRDALVVFCAGQNDLIVNFYDLSGRRLMFGDNISKYEDYLLDKLQIFIEDLYHHGCRNFGVAGIGSIGCMPSQITAMLESNGQCVMDENNDCMQYNQKLMQRLPQIQNMLPASRLVYVDMYTPLLNLINNPEKYGFEVTNRGCCGLGMFEVAALCNQLTPVCNDASKYVFWDGFHTTEATNWHVFKYVETVLPKFNH